MFEPKDLVLIVYIFALTILLLSIFFLVLIVRSSKLRATHTHQLFNAIIIGQEKERNRIAQDLHDNLGAILSAVKLQISSPHNDESIIQGIDIAIQEVRTVAKALSSRSVMEKGVVKSLDEIAASIKNRIPVFAIRGKVNEESLSEIIKLHLFRILQELITNSIRHSNCNSINIDFNHNEFKLVVQFTNNGRAVIKSKNYDGEGLHNIKNRLELLKGGFKETITESGYFAEIIIPTNKIKSEKA